MATEHSITEQEVPVNGPICTDPWCHSCGTRLSHTDDTLCPRCAVAWEQVDKATAMLITALENLPRNKRPALLAGMADDLTAALGPVEADRIDCPDDTYRPGNSLSWLWWRSMTLQDAGLSMGKARAQAHTELQQYKDWMVS